MPAAVLIPAVLILDWLVAVAWLLRALAWWLQIKRVPDLAKNSPDVRSPALPGLGVWLSVIVPSRTRNEAAKIAATLGTCCSTPPEWILRSLPSTTALRMRTGAIMNRMAADHAALRVLHVAELPAGWLGKTHAMSVAAREATGEWLLFTDGDVVFAPEALSRALGFAVASVADHFVLLPTVVLGSFGERVMISFMQVVAIWGRGRGAFPIRARGGTLSAWAPSTCSGAKPTKPSVDGLNCGWRLSKTWPSAT